MIKRQSSRAIVIIALVCALLVSSALFISGCGGNNSDNSYTIVYDSQGGAAVKNGTYTVGGSNRFYLPTPSIGSDPKMYGYSFTGWFYDEECTKKATTKIDTSYAKNGTVTLYAGWSNLHKINFDTRTAQTIDSLEYAYGTTINAAELPVPEARVVGTATCKFLYWAFLNTNEKVSETFTMEAVDINLFAVYDTGVNTRFELTDDGYYIPTSTDGKSTQTRFSDYTLNDGEIYSVDMTLPADWSTYTDDCGPVFTASQFYEKNTSFIGSPYVTMFISAPTKANGAIEFWGDVDTPNGTVDAQLIARYRLGGDLLKDTPYEKKMLAYQESNEEATFTLTYRRVERDVDGVKKISYYIGIDGIEYVCLTTGEVAVRYSEISNAANAFSTKHTGNLVGLRAKTKGVKYSNITVKKASELNVKFYAENGGEAIESKSFEYGKAMGALPVATREGFDFAGWYYTDYITGTKKALTAETIASADMFNIEAVAQWRKTGAKPYTVKFATGVEGYDVADVTGWYEGNEIKLPELAYTMMEFDGNWYYEAECLNVVDFDNIDTEKADITGADTDEPVLTIYAKASKKQFLEGEGTEENPFLVKTEADLNKFAEFVNAGETLAGYYIKLENDIVLSGAFTQIGSRTKVFSGVFDGNGKTISGMTLEGNTFLGMFAVLKGATVKNFTLEGIVVGEKGVNGLLAGQLQTGTTVENVTVKGSVSGGGSDVGGIAGATVKTGDDAIVVKNCVNYAEITVTAANAAGVAAAGGIIGATVSQLIIIENCSNYGKISSCNTFAGGIVGLFRECRVETKISGCYNYGDISGTIQVGGIVGGNRYVVENSYVLATAKINGTEAQSLVLDGVEKIYIGAIVGRLESTSAKRTAGGLCDADGKPVTVKITAELNTDGGTLPEGVTSPVEIIAETAALGQLPVPAKEGYRFVRWELKVVSGEGEEQTVSYVAITETTVFHGPARTVELVARYVEQVTVTVNADGGEYNGETTITLDKGGKLAADALGAPAKEGYTFLGWFNGDTRVTADDVYEADVEIKAHWEQQAQKSTIKFNSDGALVDSKELNVGDEIGTLPVPAAKAGYRFDGWYDVDGNKITENSTFEASVVELNAKWVLQTVITFTAEGGTISGEATKSIDAGTAIGTLPTATTSVAGEAFGGWLTADGKLVDETTVFAADVTAITLTASFGWDGETVSESLSGEGTEEAPYLISSGADLAYLASSVNGGNNYSGKYIVLTKNVNMNFKAWTPIGKAASTPFAGIFDGKNQTISNLNVQGSTLLGMFGVLSAATVKNITVGGTVVATGGVNGILAGQIASGTTVENVTVKGSVIGGATDNGGIAGNTLKTTDAQITISNCKNYANITTKTTSTAAAGGIFGATAVKPQAIIIENCSNYGEIVSTGNFAGGIVGLFRACSGLNTKITGCYNFGNITGALQVGGIVGGNRMVVEDSYVLSTAKINGKAASEYNLDGAASPFVGAITGRLEGGVAKRTGGGLCDAKGVAITE